MEENQTTGLHFIGTNIEVVVSGNVQNSKKETGKRDSKSTS